MVIASKVAPWVAKAVGIVAVPMIAAFIAWMTSVSGQLAAVQQNYIELRTNVAAIEKRMESQREDELRRWVDLQAEIRRGIEKLELKLDKIVSDRLGDAR